MQGNGGPTALRKNQQWLPRLSSILGSDNSRAWRISASIPKEDLPRARNTREVDLVASFDTSIPMCLLATNLARRCEGDVAMSTVEWEWGATSLVRGDSKQREEGSCAKRFFPPDRVRAKRERREEEAI